MENVVPVSNLFSLNNVTGVIKVINAAGLYYDKSFTYKVGIKYTPES